MAQYIATLKKIANECNFGTALEDNIRDQIIFGPRSDSISQRLLAEKSLTYDKALEVSLNMEAAEINATCMEKATSSPASPSVSINIIGDKQQLSKFRATNKCRHFCKKNNEEMQCRYVLESYSGKFGDCYCDAKG